jgi:hypothetical protein
MISTMAESRKEESSDAWVTSTAVVTGCQRTFSTSFVDESVLTDGIYEVAQFVINFSYEADGNSYDGRYMSGVPREDGYCFGILYDPKRPTRNTASEAPENGLMGWPRWKAVCFIVVASVVTLILLACFNR